MNPQRRYRKPDLFSVVVILVALGMTVTLAYQVNVYYGADQIPIAEQSLRARTFGG